MTATKLAKNHKLPDKESFWFKPVFKVKYQNRVRLCDGSIIFLEKPKWTYRKHDGKNLPKAVVQGKNINRFAECTLKIQPLKITQYESRHSGEIFTVVWFSNGIALDLRYYEAVLALCPKAKWFAQTADRIIPNQVITAKLGDKEIAIVMPLNAQIPEEMRGEFSYLESDWFGIADNYVNFKTTKSLYKPESRDGQIWRRWYATLDELKSYLEAEKNRKLKTSAALEEEIKTIDTTLSQLF